ncbi:hypothetical protein [Stygiolobus caldivivus]|uniref:Uncharacterized protein n=1 Tax=Stygiolobus caldivivus TaxID=2824673 RepID=A0A8D5U7G4_9CREN|nr:hypothetical protein [Stygiolobus caldivivus]BCU70194.1 hypothetical protein KN1_14910 [Stygiolobus caldivivus]
MVESVVQTMIIVIAVLIIGLVVFGFTSAFLAPTEAFTIAEQQASQLASQTTISPGPLLVSSNGVGSILVEAYDPSYSGNYTVYVFLIPSYLVTSAGVVTPNLPVVKNVNFQVYLPNKLQASQITATQIYDINGNQLYQGKLSVYTIPSNTPVTIDMQGVPNGGKGYYVVIWVMFNNGLYMFRVGYAYTGVPSSTG